MCPECVCEMKEVAGKRMWICSKKKLHPSGKMVKESQLKGTVDDGVRAMAELSMQLCNCFFLKMTCDITVKLIGASRQTISNWFSKFREICMEKIRNVCPFFN